jgi:hypothetical protein
MGLVKQTTGAKAKQYLSLPAPVLKVLKSS